MIGLVPSDPKSTGNTDHSTLAMKKSDEARFNEQDAAARASEAREPYKSALRKVNYDF